MVKVNTNKAIVETSLFAFSFFKFPLQCLGYDAPEGMILLTEDEPMSKEAIRRLTKLLDATELKNFKMCREEIENFRLVIHRYQRGESVEKLIEFLESRRFFPIIIVGGIVPEELKGQANVVRYNLMNTQSGNFAYAKMKEKIIKENEFLLQDLQNLKNMRIYQENIQRSTSAFWLYLIAVGRILWNLLISELGEDEADKWLAQFLAFWEKTEVDQERFLDFYDIGDAIKSRVFQMVSEKQIQVVPIDGYLEAEKKQIFYDEKFYYVAEKQLKAICLPLEASVSFLHIKRELQKSGVLQSDQTEGNFTIKKIVYDASTGEEKRLRFLKLNKEKLLSEEGLYLEDCQDGGDEYADKD